LGYLYQRFQEFSRLYDSAGTGHYDKIKQGKMDAPYFP
jgi:hypothetical protein